LEKLEDGIFWQIKARRVPNFLVLDYSLGFVSLFESLLIEHQINSNQIDFRLQIGQRS